MYLGLDVGDSHVFQIDDFKQMDRMYEWRSISSGIMDKHGVRQWPWSPSIDFSTYMRPEFKEFLETYATSEDGTPQYSIRWKDVQVKNSYSWRLRVIFYRDQAATMFRLTYE